jgi:hypothetical protein
MLSSSTGVTSTIEPFPSLEIAAARRMNLSWLIWQPDMKTQTDAATQQAARNANERGSGDRICGCKAGMEN